MAFDPRLGPARQQEYYMEQVHERLQEREKERIKKKQVS
jgi:hypothetical protein